MLLNLASVSQASDKAMLWNFILRYAPDASPEGNPDLDAAVGFAVRYYKDFVEPQKVFRLANDQEQQALETLVVALKSGEAALAVIAQKNKQEGKDIPLPEVNFSNDEFLQSIVFAVGKVHGFDPLRTWFSCLYEVLLGAKQGPRFGGFIALYGVKESVALIEAGLAGALMKSKT
jgi:lysyl-tRNA synthetase class 1